MPTKHFSVDPRSQKPAVSCKTLHKAASFLDAPFTKIKSHTDSYTNAQYSSFSHDSSYLIHDIYFEDSNIEALIYTHGQTPLPETLRVPPSCAPDNFEIKKMGKKGLGMFAKQDIPSGGLILVEHPIFVSPHFIGLSTPMADLYAALCDRLSPRSHQAFLNLANCKSPSECSLLEDIVRTNALPIELEVPEGWHSELAIHDGIFLNTSRCNHSCGPNANWQWDLTSFSLYLAAVRPIRAREEITIHYLTPDLSHRERRDALRSTYSFDCQCQYCNLPDKGSVHRSDHARQILNQIWSQLPTFEEWCLDSSMPDDALLQRHECAIRLIEQEGLEMLQYTKHLDAIAMCHGALENVEMFRTWTKRVRDVRSGSDPMQAIVLAKWISNPTSFPVWGWRKTLCKTENQKCVS